jgi:hypothetical protein
MFKKDRWKFGRLDKGSQEKSVLLEDNSGSATYSQSYQIYHFEYTHFLQQSHQRERTKGAEFIALG